MCLIVYIFVQPAWNAHNSNRVKLKAIDGSNIFSSAITNALHIRTYNRCARMYLCMEVCSGV